MVSSWYLRGYIMATQNSYTTVKVSRFGFSVMSVTLDRVHTEDVKAVACSLIALATKADEQDEIEFIRSKWIESMQAANKYTSFCIESDGNIDTDYNISIMHFDITEQQRINAVRAEPDVSDMFL